MTRRKNLLRWARYRARNKGIEFTLTVDDIDIPEVCPVLGIPLVTGTGRSTDGSPSLDRIDNDLGYTPDNVVVISHKANSIKRTATPDELLRVGCYWAAIKSGRNN